MKSWGVITYLLPLFCLAGCVGVVQQEQKKRDAELLKAVTFEYGNWDAADVARLLAAGAHVDARDERGCTPLLNAYGVGRDLFEDDPRQEEAAESLNLLLAAGSDVQARTPEGFNAMDLALCQYDNANLVRILREKGVKASKPEYELVWHAMHNHADEVRRLLAAGVSPDAHSADGWSAVWAAMPILNLKKCSEESLEILLKAGADTQELRYGEQSLLDFAEMFRGEEMSEAAVELLKQHGATYHSRKE